MTIHQTVGDLLDANELWEKIGKAAEIIGALQRARTWASLSKEQREIVLVDLADYYSLCRALKRFHKGR